MATCNCGCGKSVRDGQRFVWGHNAKGRPKGCVGWSKGLTKEICISKKVTSEKLIGNKVLVENGRRIGLRNRGRIRSAEFRKRVGGRTYGRSYEEMYGEEKSRLIKDKFRNRWYDGFLGGRHKCRGKIKGYFWSEKNGKTLYYRSSYELLAFQILEGLEKVKRYEVEIVRIPYEWKGSIHRYVVDLLVWYDAGSRELIEIKMNWAVSGDERTKIKIEAGKRYAEQNGIKYSVWTEDNCNKEASDGASGSCRIK